LAGGICLAACLLNPHRLKKTRASNRRQGLQARTATHALLA